MKWPEPGERKFEVLILILTGCVFSGPSFTKSLLQSLPLRIITPAVSTTHEKEV